MKTWLKGLLNSDKVIEETGDTVKNVVTVRTKFIRFAKICLIALGLIFLGIALLMAIKSGDKELTAQMLEAFLSLLK